MSPHPEPYLNGKMEIKSTKQIQSIWNEVEHYGRIIRLCHNRQTQQTYANYSPIVCVCILIVLFLDRFHHLSDLVLEAQWATPYKSLESSRPPIKGFILPLVLTF